MTLSPHIFEFSTAAILSWLVVAAILPLLKKRIIDTPNTRSSHSIPTPRGAGIAFVLVGSLMYFFSTTENSRWIPIICIPLAIVGLIDDHTPIPSGVRYIFQVITAIGLLSLSDLTLNSINYCFLLVLITAIINFTNFMDGLDGLVAGSGVLLMASTSSWCLSGAIFGFLFWNWSPAHVFMGDVGSTFIGAVFAGMILQNDSPQEVMSLLVIGFPLLADSSVCLIRRYLNGEHIFEAHKKHLFQRLQQKGWGHGNVAILYISGVGALLLASKLGGSFILAIVLLAEIIIGVYLDCFVAKPFIPK